MNTHHEQCRHQQPKAVGHEAPSGKEHDRYFKHLDGTRQHRFLELVGDLPARRGKNEIGEDEQARQQRCQHLPIQRSKLAGAEGHQRNERRLEYVVVEGAEKLRKEKRPETFLAHELKLVAHRCFSSEIID